MRKINVYSTLSIGERREDVLILRLNALRCCNTSLFNLLLPATVKCLVIKGVDFGFSMRTETSALKSITRLNYL